MDWAMKLMRELRELDEDFTWLSYDPGLGDVRKKQLRAEYTRRRAVLETELATQLDSL